jgi:hypothetical protein
MQQNQKQEYGTYCCYRLTENVPLPASGTLSETRFKSLAFLSNTKETEVVCILKSVHKY